MQHFYPPIQKKTGLGRPRWQDLLYAATSKNLSIMVDTSAGLYLTYFSVFLVKGTLTYLEKKREIYIDILETPNPNIKHFLKKSRNININR